MAGAEGKSKKPNIVPIDDPLELRRALEKAIEIRARATIQPKGVDLRFDTKISSTSNAAKGFMLEKPDNIDLGLLSAGECLLLAYLPGAAVLAIGANYTGFIEPEDAAKDKVLLKFEYPHRVFRIQRRSEARLEFPAGYEVRVSLPHPSNKTVRSDKKLIDLSGKGLAFHVLSPREAELYRPGMILHNVVFKIQGTTVQADLEIRNHVPLGAAGETKGVKIGTTFAKISPSDADFIASFVLTRLTYKM